jgi:hypothetical protein
MNMPKRSSMWLLSNCCMVMVWADEVADTRRREAATSATLYA